jgi:predicted kinase
VLRSDEVRKDVAGLGHTTAAIADPGEGLYRPELTDATYGALLARARTGLELGEAVILDASWSDGRHRQAARDVAEATASDLVELCCIAPPDVAVHRIRSRLAAGGDPSDATPAVAAAMADHFGPWPTATTVDTAGTLDSSVGQALEATSRVSPG